MYIIVIIIIHSAYGVTIYGSGWRKVVENRVTGVGPTGQIKSIFTFVKTLQGY